MSSTWTSNDTEKKRLQAQAGYTLAWQPPTLGQPGQAFSTGIPHGSSSGRLQPGSRMSSPPPEYQQLLVLSATFNQHAGVDQSTPSLVLPSSSSAQHIKKDTEALRGTSRKPFWRTKKGIILLAILGNIIILGVLATVLGVMLGSRRTVAPQPNDTPSATSSTSTSSSESMTAVSSSASGSSKPPQTPITPVLVSTDVPPSSTPLPASVTSPVSSPTMTFPPIGNPHDEQTSRLP